MNVDELFDIYTCVVCKSHMLLDMSRIYNYCKCGYAVATNCYRAYFKLGDGYIVANRATLKLLCVFNQTKFELNFDMIKSSENIEEFLLKVKNEVERLMKLISFM